MALQALHATQAMREAWLYGAMLFAAFGVTLYADFEGEEFWISAEPGHSSAELRHTLVKADVMGLHPMPEEETPAELLPNGVVRIYLVSESVHS